MNKLLYITSGIVVLIWLIACLVFQAGGFIHLLLVVADIPIMLTMLGREKADIIQQF